MRRAKQKISVSLSLSLYSGVSDHDSNCIKGKSRTVNLLQLGAISQTSVDYKCWPLVALRLFMLRILTRIAHFFKRQNRNKKKTKTKKTKKVIKLHKWDQFSRDDPHTHTVWTASAKRLTHHVWMVSLHCFKTYSNQINSKVFAKCVCVCEQSSLMCVC